jgi:putative heme transporter
MGEPGLVRAPLRNRSRRQLLVGVATSALVVGAAYAFGLPRVANYHAVWAIARGLSWSWALVLLVATGLNIATFAPPWMIALPGLGFLNALRMTQASTAFSLVMPGGAPVGMAASFAMLRSWGLEGGPVGLAVALTGIWNQLSIFLFPLVAVALLAAEGVGSEPLALITLIGSSLFAVIAAAVAASLSSPRFARRAGALSARGVSSLRRLIRKTPVGWSGEALVRYRAATLELLRHRWHALTAATLANQLTGYLMLDLSLRAMGIGRAEISISETFAAWSIGRLLGSLPITPGGIGVVELGLTGTLVGFGGRNAPVVAGVLVYRFLVIAPTIALGMLSAATWKLQRPQSSRNY